MSVPVRVLILGGTGEARALAAELHASPGHEVISSLAGRVSNPALPAGAVRLGGFGGVGGLVNYLRATGIDAIVDATHPFAATISAHAAEAAGSLECPLVMLRRPGWTEGPGDRWRRVPDIVSAAAVVAAEPAGAVLLTTGRRDLVAFAADRGHHYVIRTVEPPAPPLPPRRTLLLTRGPYSLDGEAALMAEHGIALLVTKDSGGPMTAAKLTAAREGGVGVVMVDRPAPPAGVRLVDTVPAAAAWLTSTAA